MFTCWPTSSAHAGQSQTEHIKDEKKSPHLNALKLPLRNLPIKLFPAVASPLTPILPNVVFTAGALVTVTPVESVMLPLRLRVDRIVTGAMRECRCADAVDAEDLSAETGDACIVMEDLRLRRRGALGGGEDSVMLGRTEEEEEEEEMSAAVGVVSVSVLGVGVVGWSGVWGREDGETWSWEAMKPEEKNGE